MRDFFRPIGPPTEDDKRQPLAKRVLWFAGLALAGLVAVAAAAYLLRAMLFIG